MTTSREVARRAGVSQATVSRVLQGHDNVSEATRDRVNAVMREVGYVPNSQARAMRTNRSGALGVVTGRITNPFYPELLQGLATQISQSGNRMAVWTSDEPSGEDAAIDAIRAHQVDGLIFTTATEGALPLRKALDAGLPVVLANRTLVGAECDQVSSDNIGGGEAVAHYFLAHGRADAAVLGGNRLVSTGAERRKGFVDAFARAGVQVRDEWQPESDFLHDAAREAGEQLLVQVPRPTAVFCVNDLVAFGVLDAARRLGIDVPGELWVVGYDDIGMAAWDVFDLTTVRQPVSEMAQVSVELLLERIADPARPVVHSRFPAELVVRGSTGGMPSGAV